MAKTVICRDMDGNQHEVPVSELTWRPAAYGIVIKDKKALLLKQYNGYDLPGGGIDLGETPVEAVIREVKEESGLTVAKPILVDVQSSFFKRSYAEGNCVESISIYYACEYVSGDINNSGHDEHEQQYAEGCVWVSVDELDDITVAASTDWRELIKKVVKAGRGGTIAARQKDRK
ncbi:MAG TPA: NUDIX domain-containing protein [Candidatus Saccharimonadales bacterium]|nr:NUDIX domain-containing protein [Candidatus Saccharimonadales bacterium]